MLYIIVLNYFYVFIRKTEKTQLLEEKSVFLLNESIQRENVYIYTTEPPIITN